MKPPLKPSKALQGPPEPSRALQGPVTTHREPTNRPPSASAHGRASAEPAMLPSEGFGDRTVRSRSSPSLISPSV
eukprot:1506853-Alexandrium_andersonii.AAC.1